MDHISVICKLAMKWYLMRMCASWLCLFKATSRRLLSMRESRRAVKPNITTLKSPRRLTCDLNYWIITIERENVNEILILVWISQNFQWRLELHSPEFSSKRPPEWFSIPGIFGGIQSALEHNSRKIWTKTGAPKHFQKSLRAHIVLFENVLYVFLQTRTRTFVSLLYLSICTLGVISYLS